MGTKMITPRKNGANLDKLTVGMRQFVLEMIANDMLNGTAAARKAGYKNPSDAANRLMKNPTILKALGKEMRLRGLRTKCKADEVLQYLHTALFFNPLKLFKPTEDGKWTIENLDDIPDEIGCLIEELKIKTTTSLLGEVTTSFEFKTVSHATALQLAMKHHGLLTDKIESAVTVKLDWDAALSSKNSNGKPNAIEQAILDVESSAVTD